MVFWGLKGRTLYADVDTIDIRGNATEAAIMYPRFYSGLV